jgi:uncharacterized protein (TIGR02246 family)
MTNEQAIRDLGQLWTYASEKRDVGTLLSLLSDDVVFIVPGQKPFGKDYFAKSVRRSTHLRIEIQSRITELTILDDWAWTRTYLDMITTTVNGEVDRRVGDVLRILRQTCDGDWLITRDTNLLMLPEAS